MYMYSVHNYSNEYLYTYVTVRITVINKLELLSAGQIRFSRSVISKKYTKSHQSDKLFLSRYQMENWEFGRFIYLLSINIYLCI